MEKKKTAKQCKTHWYLVLLCCSAFDLQSPVFTLYTIFWLVKARRKERREMFLGKIIASWLVLEDERFDSFKIG